MAAACRLVLCCRDRAAFAHSAFYSDSPTHNPRTAQESGEALLQRMRSERAAAAAPAAPAAAPAPAPQLRELTPAEGEKEEGNKAFKRGDWRAAAEHYTRCGGVQ